MKFYLTGGWGYGNKGDNAIFEAMRQSLETEFPGHELLVSSFSPEETLEQHGMKALPSIHKFLTKKAPLGLLRWCGIFAWKLTGIEFLLGPTLRSHLNAMRDSDAVIMGGGGYFNDAWLDMLFSRFAEIELAHAAKTPLVMLGQTIGPFGRPWMTSTLAKYLAKVSQVAYRDEQSLRVLDRVKLPKDKIRLSADEVNIIKVDAEPELKNSPMLKIGVMIQIFRPHLSVDGPSPAGKIKSEQSYLDTLVDALTQFLSRHQGVEFHFIPSTRWDEATCRKVHDRMSARAQCVFHTDPHIASFIALCQNIDVMLSTNMHPIILATTASKPSVGISYHYKLDDYMKSVSQGDNLVRIDDFDAAQLASMLDRVVSMRTQIKVGNDGPKSLARNNILALKEALLRAQAPSRRP